MNRTFTNAAGVQRRSVVAELRDTGDEWALVGHASVFNTWSKPLGGFRERVMPGTFAESCRNAMQGEGIVCLFNHDASQILGRTTSGTLTVKEDERGLWYRCQLNPASQAHRDLYESIKRKDISMCSFSFLVPKDGQSWTEGKDPDNGADCAFRTLTKVDLIDVSPVTMPAYGGTDVSAREARADYGGGTNPANDRFAIDAFKRLAAIMGASEIRELRQAAFPGRGDFKALERVYQRCMELASASMLCSDIISDTLAGWDDDDDSRARRGKQDLYPYDTVPGDCGFRNAHRDSHAAISGAVEAMAKTRLALARCTKGK